MKKYAMLMLNPQFESQHFKIDAGNVEHHIIMVSSMSESLMKVDELANLGFGAIEICGAFGKEAALELYEATRQRVPVGFVIYPTNQIEHVQRFWDCLDEKEIK